jgi:hypothetical protein
MRERHKLNKDDNNFAGDEKQGDAMMPISR